MTNQTRSKTQLVVMRVSFDKPVSKLEAARLVASNMKGETFSGTAQRENGAEHFTIRSIQPA